MCLRGLHLLVTIVLGVLLTGCSLVGYWAGGVIDGGAGYQTDSTYLRNRLEQADAERFALPSVREHEFDSLLRLADPENNVAVGIVTRRATHVGWGLTLDTIYAYDGTRGLEGEPRMLPGEAVEIKLKDSAGTRIRGFVVRLRKNDIVVSTKVMVMGSAADAIRHIALGMVREVTMGDGRIVDGGGLSSEGARRTIASVPCVVLSAGTLPDRLFVPLDDVVELRVVSRSTRWGVARIACVLACFLGVDIPLVFLSWDNVRRGRL
jgi:hypothetical protein